MASPFAKVEPFTQVNLVKWISETFESLPDNRSGKGVYQKYTLSDAALSAFSVFFMQSPSFLDHQIELQQAIGNNNVQGLFGVHQIPSDNQIRNLLDGVPADTLRPLYWRIFKGLQDIGKLKDFEMLQGTTLVALDGTEYFNSQKIQCECCSTKVLKNGKIQYSHRAVTPVVVSPNQDSIIPLAPEFIQPQDGRDKQDYELAASKRWLASQGHHLPTNTTILGDDLYCSQPFCQQLLGQKLHFILVCQPDSHKTLYEWVDDFQRTGDVRTVEIKRWTGKERQIERYRYVNQVPLRNTDDALMVNWCEVEIINAQGKVIYRNAFATDYTLTDNNVVAIVKAGRTRWKIENENNNTLKTKGYNFGHNFGHGKKHLAALLASLIILALLFHTLLTWFDKCYQLLRQRLSRRQKFFDDIRALTRYSYFDSWQSLMEFMLRGLKIPIPDS